MLLVGAAWMAMAARLIAVSFRVVLEFVSWRGIAGSASWRPALAEASRWRLVPFPARICLVGWDCIDRRSRPGLAGRLAGVSFHFARELPRGVGPCWPTLATVAGGASRWRLVPFPTRRARIAWDGTPAARFWCMDSCTRSCARPCRWQGDRAVLWCMRYLRALLERAHGRRHGTHRRQRLTAVSFRCVWDSCRRLGSLVTGFARHGACGLPAIRRGVAHHPRHQSVPTHSHAGCRPMVCIGGDILALPLTAPTGRLAFTTGSSCFGPGPVGALHRTTRRAKLRRGID